MRPSCFESQNQFYEWQQLARTAAEPVRICDDCSVQYEQQMCVEKRCMKTYWQKEVFMESKHKKKVAA